MSSVFIDSRFFALDEGYSQNLLSGLLKLKQRNFDIYSDIEFQTGTNFLSKILSLEEITIIPHSDNNGYDFALLADEKLKLKNKIEYLLNDENANSVGDLISLLLMDLRHSKVHRKTNETDIKIDVILDGSGKSEIETGIGFFDHMLNQIARHSNINLSIKVMGDLEIDEHHTVEDTGIVLGEALLKALGNKKGIKRFGFCVPMDDAAALCAVDLSGRPYLNFKVKFKRDYVGEFPTELVEEFFRALSVSLKANVLIKAKGKNDHHKIESIFKAFAKSLNEALRFDERSPFELPSTKGII